MQREVPPSSMYRLLLLTGREKFWPFCSNNLFKGRKGAPCHEYIISNSRSLQKFVRFNVSGLSPVHTYSFISKHGNECTQFLVEFLNVITKLFQIHLFCSWITKERKCLYTSHLRSQLLLIRIFLPAVPHRWLSPCETNVVYISVVWPVKNMSVHTLSPKPGIFDYFSGP